MSARELQRVGRGEAYPKHGDEALIKYRFVTPEGEKWGIQVESVTMTEIVAWNAQAAAAGAHLERYDMSKGGFVA